MFYYQKSYIFIQKPSWNFLSKLSIFSGEAIFRTLYLSGIWAKIGLRSSNLGLIQFWKEYSIFQGLIIILTKFKIKKLLFIQLWANQNPPLKATKATNLTVLFLFPHFFFPIFISLYLLFSEDQEYEVEKILQQKTQKGKPVYLVKWKGFPESDATWEPARNLSNSQNLLKKFQEASPEKDSDKSDTSSSVLSNSKKIKKADKSPKRSPSAASKPTKGAKQAKQEKQAKQAKKADKADKADKKSGKAEKGGKAAKKGGSEKSSKSASFETDKPSKITDHGVLDDEQIRDVFKKTSFDKLFFSVEWKPRSDGTKPQESYFTFETLKTKCPDVLLDYIHQMSCSE